MRRSVLAGLVPGAGETEFGGGFVEHDLRFVEMRDEITSMVRRGSPYCMEAREPETMYFNPARWSGWMKVAKRSGVSTEIDFGEFGEEACVAPVGMLATEGFVFPEAGFLEEFDAQASAASGAHGAPCLDLEWMRAVVRGSGRWRGGVFAWSDHRWVRG